MPALAPSDVAAYTHGRLAANDAEVIRMLKAAMVVARRECGWHVNPVRADELTLDGPDSRILWLPTLKVVTLAGVEENGTVLDVDTIAQSSGDGPGLPRRVSLRKRSRGYWTDEYSGLTVLLTHGYDDDEAADWRQAVLSMVDQMSLIPIAGGSGVSEFGLSSKRIDDVDYRYSPYAAMAEDVVFSVSSIFDDYRLPSVEYF